LSRPWHHTRRSSFGFNAAPYEKTVARYNPIKLKDGFNTLPDGEEIFYISNPALGLPIVFLAVEICYIKRHKLLHVSDRRSAGISKANNDASCWYTNISVIFQVFFLVWQMNTIFRSSLCSVWIAFIQEV